MKRKDDADAKKHQVVFKRAGKATNEANSLKKTNVKRKDEECKRCIKEGKDFHREKIGMCCTILCH